MNNRIVCFLLTLIIHLTIVSQDVVGQDSEQESDLVDLYENASPTQKQLFTKSNAALENILKELEVSKKIKIAPVTEIEQFNQDQGLWYLGVVFFLFIDGKNDPRFTYSAVGAEEMKEDVINAVIEEWGVCFVNPFISYLVKSDQFEYVDDMKYYFGVKLVRGGETGLDFGLPGQIESEIIKILHPYLKKTIYYLNGKPVDNPRTHTINIKLSIYPDGQIDGECIWNGQSSPWIIPILEEIEWPTTKDGYFVKQFFIYTPQ